MDRIDEIMRRCFRILEPDTAAFYAAKKDSLVLDSFKGCTPETETIPMHEESMDFLITSGHALSVLNIREEGKDFFRGIIIGRRMTCGIASAHEDAAGFKGVFIFNYINPYRFSFSQIREIEKTIPSGRR